MEEETTSYTCRLSSRRVTTARIKDIAASLGLPTDATKDDLLCMIESKLAKGGREPRNVQVTVSGRKLTLPANQVFSSTSRQIWKELLI